MNLFECEVYPPGTKFQVTDTDSKAFLFGEILVVGNEAESTAKYLFSTHDFTMICLQPLFAAWRDTEVVLLPDHAKVTL